MARSVRCVFPLAFVAPAQSAVFLRVDLAEDHREESSTQVVECLATTRDGVFGETVPEGFPVMLHASAATEHRRVNSLRLKGETVEQISNHSEIFRLSNGTASPVSHAERPLMFGCSALDGANQPGRQIER